MVVYAAWQDSNPLTDFRMPDKGNEFPVLKTHWEAQELREVRLHHTCPILLARKGSF